MERVALRDGKAARRDGKSSSVVDLFFSYMHSGFDSWCSPLFLYFGDFLFLPRSLFFK